MCHISLFCFIPLYSLHLYRRPTCDCAHFFPRYTTFYHFPLNIPPHHRQHGLPKTYHRRLSPPKGHLYSPQIRRHPQSLSRDQRPSKPRLHCPQRPQRPRRPRQGDSRSNERARRRQHARHLLHLPTVHRTAHRRASNATELVEHDRQPICVRAEQLCDAQPWAERCRRGRVLEPGLASQV